MAFSSAKAQENPGPQVGLGILYGDEPQAVGIQVNGAYFVQPNIALAPDVSIYFPNDDNGYDGYWAINLNGHYFFANDPQYSFYGLGGLNIATANFAGDFPDDTNTRLGINVGIGGEYKLQQFSVFGEIKYIISDLDQVVLGAGVRVPINEF